MKEGEFLLDQSS